MLAGYCGRSHYKAVRGSEECAGRQAHVVYRKVGRQAGGQADRRT